MKEEKKYRQYTAKDITNYLAGRLQPGEMHDMEKAALDDPFLAEAIEGYAGMGVRDWNKELAGLKEQIAARQNTARLLQINRSTGKWWKAVAAVLVIGTGAGITYWFSNGSDQSGNKNQDIAQVFPLNKIDSTVSPSRDNADTAHFIHKGVTNNLQQPVVKNASGRIDDQGAVTITAKTSAALDSISGYNSGFGKDIAGNDKAPVVDNKPVTVNKAVVVNAVPVQSATALDEMAKNKARRQPITQNNTAPLNRSFIAQVVGPDNTPLPYANINIPNANFGTYADVKGNFRLVSSDSIVKVEVRSVGYLTQNYTLHLIPGIQKIILPEDETALMEKTPVIDKKTIGRTTVNRRAALIRDSVVNVEPADGWDNYRTYVDNNMDIPADIFKNESNHEVRVSFDVRPNGSVANVKVDGANCEQCVEAARKLIEQGPQWKLTNGKKATARIRLQF